MILKSTTDIVPWYERSEKARDLLCAANVKEEPRQRAIAEFSALINALKGDDYVQIKVQLAEARIAIGRLQISLGNRKAVDYEVMEKLNKF